MSMDPCGTILILALAALAAAKIRTSQATCAFIASHQKKHPGYAVAATAAFECLNSVPVDTQGNLALIDELKQLWQFHSETGWLKNPGPDWEDGPIDIIDELDKVKSGLEAGTYQSEYEVQMAIQSITVRSGSDHLTYNPDILRVFVFVRHFSVASISSDGKALPKLYVNTDVAALANGGNVSDIKSINGMDPYDFLKANFFSPSRDSDGRMNAMFSTGDTKGMGRFRVQEMYRGPTTDVVWSNSKKTSFQNIAGIRQDFRGVVDGESFFRKFCTGALTRHHSGKSKRGEDGVIPPNILDPAPTIPNGTYHPSARVERRDIPFKGVYPIAVAGNKGSNVAGYFLQDDGFEDVAVLKIISFGQPKNRPTDFEDRIRSFLNQSIAHNKQKLVIDLRENGGGLAHLCLEAFMQLFPELEPFAGMRSRATDVYNKIGDVVSEVRSEPLLAAQVDLGPLRRFWDWWGLRTARGDSFDSWEQFKGPFSVNDDDFTATWRWGYATGYKGRYPTAFDPSNVVMLTDASCHSACAALHEELRNIAGVKTVTVGGRPENGPIQAVTGTRGGHIVEISELAEISRIALGISSDYELQSVAPDDEVLWRAANASTVTKRAGGGLWVQMVDKLRKGDETRTPLQFTYEAADCRIFYTAESWADPVEAWKQAWTAHTDYSKCVEGSTGHKSSISGGSKPHGPGPFSYEEEQSGAEEEPCGREDEPFGSEEEPLKKNRPKSSRPSGAANSFQEVSLEVALLAVIFATIMPMIL
ncbi:hypothetical protein CPLU01_08416 [Colletotrichum plurivorum]|uniref:Tail specific protease domain-containing protein n=1 Tax=Colletotrichum plurivorum TaxID=2175906 RepID=A0A8H6NCM9_9PEZI|nr:hypothetical protein CPLU01_08416 [Colletotrichum plurivorum]